MDIMKESDLVKITGMICLTIGFGIAFLQGHDGWLLTMFGTIMGAAMGLEIGFNKGANNGKRRNFISSGIEQIDS